MTETTEHPALSAVTKAIDIFRNGPSDNGECCDAMVDAVVTAIPALEALLAENAELRAALEEATDLHDEDCACRACAALAKGDA